MGKGARPKTKRLAGKLLRIRQALGLSQTDLLHRLGAQDMITYHRISDYELGKNEPPLLIILQYAKAANVSTDALIDDDLDMPDELPSAKRSEGVRRHGR